MAKVISIRVLEPAPGATLADYQAFLQELSERVFKADGWKGYFVRGDRGERSGKFAMVQEFASVEARNRYFPVADAEQPPEATAKLMNDFWPDDLSERWQALVAPGDAYTDYIYPD